MLNSHSSQARFIAVVGPSGVGKDSLMDAMIEARSDLHRVRRVITRAANAGGEDSEPVTQTQFNARAAQGDFALHWPAHGLFYGIPADVSDVLGSGQDALANLSRGMLAQADAVFDHLVVLNVTATPDVLAQRLAQRGRESRDDISKRLARAAPALPAKLTVHQIDNSGELQVSVQAALDALYPERG